MAKPPPALLFLLSVLISANGYWLSSIPLIPRSRQCSGLTALEELNSFGATEEFRSIPFTGIKKHYSWSSSSDSSSSSSSRKCVSDADESRITPILVRKSEYISNLNLDAARKEEIRLSCDRLNVSFEQALSLRKQLLVEKVASKTQFMMKRFEKLNRLYNQGESVISLSASLDIPAMALMRSILLARLRENHSRLQLRDRIYRQIVRTTLRIGEIGNDEEAEKEKCDVKENGKASCFKKIISDIFTERDIAEVAEAKIVDQISYSNQDDTNMEKTSSLGWENQLFEWLRQNNISFLDESVLRQYNLASTPDVLLLDDVYIDGTLVRWMDVKCYYGSTASKIFLGKLREQNQRYLKEFSGSGAFVYKLSFSEGLRKCFSETLILDQGPLHVN